MLNGQAGQKLRYTIKDAEGNVLETKELGVEETKTSFEIKDVHRWNGVKDPYLYTAEIELVDGEEVIDKVSTRFGCREFAIDPEKGFFLNGVSYPLHGVSRHQDRWGIGNALLPEHHEEDIELIMELGANTIRLAHYQHDQYFYDLCESGDLYTSYDGYVSNIDDAEDAINWEINALNERKNEKYGILSGLVNAWDDLCTRIRNFFN